MSEPQVVRHERALDELLWAIYVYLVDPHAVITVGEPQDKPVEEKAHGER